ncbi:carboxypeptidase regulatory-like domain-containing protein [Candidatus Albibeggiatoa sp. nov. NOAA]|uniref:carboxypeptidase regulatory-like domain-containing protein n=1 Tax=Candidatus Albibeggiatoa sp. nov. NOAA TaxID=3162724 RepID=UPI0032FC5FF3|nr:carboxypeptidase regulatory-like domain-containing protein [Thiotrichaceae bacterium]
MKKLVIIWILSFLSYATWANDFQLNIAPSQSSFELGTPVHLTVSLTNTSVTEQQLPQQFNPEYGLIKYEIGGLAFTPWEQTRHLFAEKTFAPNETVTQEVPIYFGNRGWIFHSRGYYSVIASYNGVASNRTQIIIDSAPSNSKTYKAADILLQSRQAGLVMLGKSQNGLLSGVERLKQVVALYPNTLQATYANQALETYTENRTHYFAQSILALENETAKPWFSYTLPELIVSSDSFEDISQLTQGSDWLNDFFGVNDNLYRVSGYIKNKNGLAISDVNIKVEGGSATTDADGYYEINNLPEGEYELLASKQGYQFNPTTFIVSSNNPDVKVHVSAPSSDLSVEIELIPFIVFEGEPLITYSIQVTNEGDEAATRIELTNELPQTVSFQAVDTESGSCQQSGLTVNCSLPTLNPDQTWIVQVHAVPHGIDTLVSVAHVKSKQYPDDSDTLTAPVRPYFSALLWTNPNPVLVNEHVLYQLRIMNNKYSPKTAKDIELAFDIPAGTDFLTAETRDGYCKQDSQQLICDLDDIAPNGQIDIEITAKPSQSGNIQQTFSLTSSDFDEYRSTQNLMVLDPDAAGNADLVILIDDTGSMQEDITGVKRALYQIISELDEMEGLVMPRIAILTFKDDVTQRIVSNDFKQLLSAVSRLNASGGGLCPEASVQAMAEGLSLLKDGGQLLLVTDASPHPDTHVSEVLEVMEAKSAILNVMLSGRCQTESVSDPLVRESKTRRLVRASNNCDNAFGNTIAHTEELYSCMVGHTGGLYAWNNDVKKGIEHYLAELQSNIVTVLRRAVEAANTDVVFTDDSEQVIDAIASELYNPPLGYVVLSIAAPNGRVVDENLSIDCNQQACQYYLKRGTEVSLTPIAPEGMYLYSWGGSPGCNLSSFDILDPKGCLAVFYNTP